jgi:hypothetical protein
MPLVFVAVVSDMTIRCATGFWQAAGYTTQRDQARFVRHAEH